MKKKSREEKRKRKAEFDPFPSVWEEGEEGEEEEEKNIIAHLIRNEWYSPEVKRLLMLEPHQLRILNTVFTPKKGKLPYSTIVWSCIKKSGKTDIAAAVMLMWARVYGGDCFSIANDLKQAQGRAFERVWHSLEFLKNTCPEEFEEIVHEDYHKNIVKRNRDGGDQILLNNGARMTPIPCDPYGEAGGMQTLTVWDELWAYRSETVYRLWEEMQPLPPGVGAVKESIRFVVSYAGWYGESELLWDIYNRVVKPDDNDLPHGKKVEGLEDLPCYEDGSTFVYWDHEPRMPWHTQAYLENARKECKTLSEYLRLWENRWTTGESQFIDMEMFRSLVRLGKSAGFWNRMEHIPLEV